jgi:hypothetical protein
MQNPNFVFGKRKKAWFAKNFAFKNQVLGMKLKASFSKRDFDKKHDKKWVTKRTHRLLCAV